MLYCNIKNSPARIVSLVVHLNNVIFANNIFFEATKLMWLVNNIICFLSSFSIQFGKKNARHDCTTSENILEG